MRNLKVGEMFHLDEFSCHVCQDGDIGYALRCSPNNDSVFTKFSINKLDLQQSILGYKDRYEGTFPYCKTLEDLTKFVFAIKVIVDAGKNPADVFRVGQIKYIGGYEFAVNDTSHDGYYLSCRTTTNEILFKNYGIDKMALQREVLGYSDGEGAFPYCKTLADLTIFVKAIEEIVASKKGKPAAYSTEPTKETPAYSTEPTKKESTDSYKIDVSPEPIKRTDRLRTFLLIN